MRSITILFLVILLYGCSDTPKNDSKNGQIQSAKVNARLSGEQLFAAHCKLCHGQAGNLQLNGAKDLTISTLSQNERVVLITNGKNAMTPFKKLLTDEEIRRVAEYSQTLVQK